MAFEDLIKSGHAQISSKPSPGLVNFSSNLAMSHHDHVVKREELLQSVMICQGEYDYLALQVKAGNKALLDSFLDKKSELIEKNIVFSNTTGLVDPGDLVAVNRQSDKLTKYRMELEAIKQARKNQGQYIEEILKQINLGVDLEGTMVDSQESYLTVISDKIKFGGIVDQSRVSRLCGFGSMAAKSGDLIVAIKSYSIAGMLFSVREDLKRFLKKAKKQKNPQSQEAEQLFYNLLPKGNKK